MQTHPATQALRCPLIRNSITLRVPAAGAQAIRGLGGSNSVVSVRQGTLETQEDVDRQGPVRALAVDTAPWQSPRAGRLLHVVAFAIAAAAHGALLYALARAPADDLAGGGGQQIDAISINLVSSNVLESREAERTETAPPAAASVESSDGAPESAPAPTAEAQERKEKFIEDVLPVEALTEIPKQEEPEKKRASAAKAEGGAAIRSDEPTAAEAHARAPAAASAGAVREYARYVALALSKTKPKSSGGLGTARVKFAIADDGAVAAAEITTSSGHKKLDDSALAAVRRTRFPTPPAGMTPIQLTFEVPYRFR